MCLVYGRSQTRRAACVVRSTFIKLTSPLGRIAATTISRSEKRYRGHYQRSKHENSIMDRTAYGEKETPAT
ncbi:hypothetical protein EVAR_96961_1 [Eumeta japonica]|uniref:Uncharacterized protein n=1 Tax=Eumeta variegata TaxID=151549 RepID=A0A4C1VCU5_EUMVA|nr:hypothetical protein EVAR_96961_1 [Eumeta japonica]